MYLYGSLIKISTGFHKIKNLVRVDFCKRDNLSKKQGEFSRFETLIIPVKNF
jgi:hypothetical protein